MCGIAGIVAKGQAPLEPEVTALVAAMTGRLAHRGPDASGTWTAPSGRSVLGHARLRVIDLVTGDQPVTNEDGSVAGIVNGAIYNFRTVRAQLEDRGHHFHTAGDSEIAIHAYEEWGRDMAGHLEGQFAFAIWDDRRRTLLLGRDRVGMKPLFVYEDDVRLAWASELKGLLQIPELNTEMDRSALPLYLSFGYVPSPKTFYRRIRKLQPASCLLLEDGKPAVDRTYWDVSFDRRAVAFSQAKEEVRNRVEAAVKRRLIADVPVGAFLSGGIDSTIIAAVMSASTPGPVRTFSVGFEGVPTYDETPYARRVSELLGTEHSEIRIGPESIRDLDSIVEAYDEPFGDSSAVPTYAAARLASEHVTVALTGEGGDDLFCGYLRFRAMELAGAIPDWAARLARLAAGRLPYHSDFRSTRRRVSRFFEAAGLGEAQRWLHWVGFFTADLDLVLQPAVPTSGSLDIAAGVRAVMERQSGSVLARSMAANFHTYLLDDLLVKADRLGMAHGLELRAPFLDTDVVEYAAALPDRHLRRGRRLKYVLRQAFLADIPPAVLRRGKAGFAAPICEWFRGPWRDVLWDRVLTPEARIWEWLRRDYVVAQAELHFNGSIDFSPRLWALLTLETWLRSEGIR